MSSKQRYKLYIMNHLTKFRTLITACINIML